MESPPEVDLFSHLRACHKLCQKKLFIITAWLEKMRLTTSLFYFQVRKLLTICNPLVNDKI